MSLIKPSNIPTYITFNRFCNPQMPKSRKRHHSRSRSKTRSRSPSRDRSYEKEKKPNSHEKDGKRRRLDEIDSPQKRSLSATDPPQSPTNQTPPKVEESGNKSGVMEIEEDPKVHPANTDCDNITAENDVQAEAYNNDKDNSEKEGDIKSKSSDDDDVQIVESQSASIIMECVYDKKEQLSTPKKPLTPKQLQKKLESEKKKQQRQQEKEEREKQKQEEKARLLAEKQKAKEQKEAERQKQLEMKQKEKEMKEEQRKKEKEEKEQKRKEKEEQEALKRKEKEQEKLKKLQEVEEKNKEKQKEKELQLKSANLLKSFFKKTDTEQQKESKAEKPNSNFMPFEIKTDMRLAPLVRKLFSNENKTELDTILEQQDENVSYLKDLKSGKIKPGKSGNTWPYGELDDDEVTIVEGDKILGETICEDKSVVRKMKAKYLYFHENRRPAYYGTWRKKSKFIKPRNPFVHDVEYFNYEEDSDDDWEEEEQGESLEISGDEEEKDTENDEDDYEVDNEFFVPHGHLSEDEIDDEENARLSPESLKQKLKLLKDEFDQDIKSKTHKLKPRSFGGIWLNRNGDNIDDAIYRYLLPFAMIVSGPIEIKKQSTLFASPSEKKKTKTMVELPIEHVPYFLKIIHGNIHKKNTVIEEFLSFMAKNGFSVEVSKTNLTRFLKKSATYRRCKESGPMKNKFGWFVNDEVKAKYNVNFETALKT
ncbi:chromatin assembly factor 1 subunit A-like isoform X2 [Anthonomus grandis grandis]|uniref:chromatin assembly factor 1 subunit A-like isoform X2 n=1 Tax=Anthonomus grandis grandis TaxID=2921223 RepID=UPI0021664635|nr:chromatin assembly factor 1 subunit A-like isoform X2 [Anthonomus grandis grandis]